MIRKEGLMAKLNMNHPGAKKAPAKAMPKAGGAAAPVRVVTPKGGSTRVEKVDNGSVVRTHDSKWNTTQEIVVPEGTEIQID